MRGTPPHTQCSAGSDWETPPQTGRGQGKVTAESGWRRLLPAGRTQGGFGPRDKPSSSWRGCVHLWDSPSPGRAGQLGWLPRGKRDTRPRYVTCVCAPTPAPRLHTHRLRCTANEEEHVHPLTQTRQVGKGTLAVVSPRHDGPNAETVEQSSAHLPARNGRRVFLCKPAVTHTFGHVCFFKVFISKAAKLTTNQAACGFTNYVPGMEGACERAHAGHASRQQRVH